MSSIGLLNEKPLHASLKEWYAQPGDQFEVAIDRFVVDIVRDGLLLEIQTGNFASIKSKLKDLVDSLVTDSPPRNREDEIEKARNRAEKRF